jgi:hypothetical protein
VAAWANGAAVEGDFYSENVERLAIIADWPKTQRDPERHS